MFVLDPEIKNQELRETIFAYLPPEKLQAMIEECAKIIPLMTNSLIFYLLAIHT